MLCKNKSTRQVYCIHCSTMHSTVYYWVPNLYTVGFPGDLVLKNPPADVGDVGSIPVYGRSSGEGNDNPSWYSCLGNPMKRRTSWATVNGFAKDWTRLSDERKVKVKLLSRVRLFATPWTVAYQASLSMGFSRQEHCIGLPSPSPGVIKAAIVYVLALRD